MKKLLFPLFTIICLQGFAQHITLNDANAEKRTLTARFNAISVSDGIELLLTQGNEESVAVSASEAKYMERFKTEVIDGTLKIYYDRKTMVWNGNEKKRLRAYVSFKTLERLKASSGSNVKAKSVLSVDKLHLSFTSGSLFSGELNAGDVEVSQNSGSEINASGKATSLKVDLSSGAMFKGFDLSADFCDAKASSGGEVRINVNKELSAKANSGGGIKYKGAAVLKDINVNSGGSVKKS